MITVEQYSRKQSLNVRAAMVRAIAERLRNAKFPKPRGGFIQFSQVFEHWPDYPERSTAIVAAVLPSPVRYDAARLTPSLIDETWEPYGEVGFGLYRLADIDAEFEIQIRCPTDAERSVVLAGMETLWVADEVLMDPIAGARYGVIICMPEYFGVAAGFALKDMRVLDDENRAVREHREAIMTIFGQATQVKLAPVRPMSPVVKLTTC